MTMRKAARFRMRATMALARKLAAAGETQANSHDVDYRDDGDDQEEQRGGGGAASEVLEVDELLARIDGHGHGLRVVAGQHIDEIEDAHGIEDAEDDRDGERRLHQRQRDLE